LHFCIFPIYKASTKASAEASADFLQNFAEASAEASVEKPCEWKKWKKCKKNMIFFAKASAEASDFGHFWCRSFCRSFGRFCPFLGCFCASAEAGKKGKKPNLFSFGRSFGTPLFEMTWKASELAWKVYKMAWKAFDVTWKASELAWKASEMAWRTFEASWKESEMAWGASETAWKASEMALDVFQVA